MAVHNYNFKAASGFSFAAHEDDPTDVVTHPTGHYLKGTGAGAATGTALGALAGGVLSGGRSLGGRLGAIGLGAALGAGAGAAAGYDRVTAKRKAVERAYGAQDPFELQKLSHEEGVMQDEMLKQAYEAGYQFALMKMAAESEDRPAPLPFTVSHPYLSDFAYTTAGAGLGGLAGAVVGGLAAGTGGALLGAGAGASLGGLAGRLGAVAHHYHDRSDYADAERAAGRSGQLPFIVKHPYLSNAAISVPTGMIGFPVAVALHDHYKRLPRD